MESSHEPNCNRHHRDSGTAHKHHTVTAGLYTEASQLTVWDWKSEGGEGTGSDGSTTQKHHTVTAGLYTQSITAHTVGLEERGGRGNSDSAGTGSDGSTTQKHYTVTAGLYIQASPLTLWDWKSKGARELAVTAALHRTEKHHTVTAGL